MTDETPNSRKRSDRLTAAAKAQEARDEQVAELKREVAELREQTKKPAPAAGGGGPPAPPSIPPVRWHELDWQERDTKLEELRGWMRDVLFPQFPGEADIVEPCWAKHTTAVEVLTALWQTWVMCWADTAGPASRAQWLWVWRKQARDDLRGVLQSCADGHDENQYPPDPCVIDGINPDQQQEPAA